MNGSTYITKQTQWWLGFDKESVQCFFCQRQQQFLQQTREALASQVISRITTSSEALIKRKTCTNSSNPFNLFKATWNARTSSKVLRVLKSRLNKICCFWWTIVTWNDPKNWQVPPLCCVFGHFSWSASPATGHIAPAKWWQDQTSACMAFFRCKDLGVHVEIGQVFKGLRLPTSTQSWCLVFAAFAVKWRFGFSDPNSSLFSRQKTLWQAWHPKKHPPKMGRLFD